MAAVITGPPPPPSGKVVLTPRGKGPPPPPTGQVSQPEPSILGKMGGRFMGSDIDEDPYPFTRLSAIIAGAVGGGMGGTKAGAAGGSFFGPVGAGVGAVGGGVVGTLAGVALGAASPELTMEIGEQLGLLDAGTREKQGLSNDELKTVIEGELLLEMATGGGLAATRLAGRGAVNLWTGMGRKSRQLAEVGAREGINMMPVQVGSREMPRSFVSIFGRFPFIAGPLKRQGAEVDHALKTAFENLPARIAIPASMNEVSADIFSSLKQLAVNVDHQFALRYEDTFKLADKMGVKIKPEGTLARAEEILTNIVRDTPTAAKGKKAARPPKSIIDVRRLIQDSVLVMQDTAGKPTAQSLRQMDGLMSAIDETIGEFSKDGLDTKYLAQLRQAVAKDIMDLGRGAIGPGGMPARDVGRRLRAIDQDFSNTINAMFESATANRLGSVTRRGMGGIKYQQAANVSIDHLADILLKGDAPSTIDDLSKMLAHAPEVMKKLGATVLDRRIETSMGHLAGGATEFNVSKFAKQMGLDDKKGFRYQQTEKLLNIAGGVTMEELGKFTEFGRAIASVEIPNVSTFVARRATMGGLRTAARVLVPGLALAGGAAAGQSDSPWAKTIAGGLLFIGGGRLLSKALANPDSARALRYVLRSESGRIGQRMVSFQVFRGAVMGLVDAGQIGMEEANEMLDRSRVYIEELHDYGDQQ